MREYNFDIQPEIIEQQYSSETVSAPPNAVPIIDEVPSASESVPGKLQIATQTETNLGINDAHAVTPEKLANSVWVTRRFAQTFGNAALQNFDFTHNFNTRDCVVEVRKNGGDYETVTANFTVKRPSVNTVRLEFTAPPASNDLRVIIFA